MLRYARILANHFVLYSSSCRSDTYLFWSASFLKDPANHAPKVRVRQMKQTMGGFPLVFPSSGMLPIHHQLVFNE